MSGMATILEKTGGLVAFVRTIDTGSFASAARLIGASPSAVSKSVARLEERLGVRLLQRSTRTLSPTAEGAAYYDRVAPHLRAIEEADDIVQIPRNVRGLLRISVVSTLGRPLIAAWAGSFLERYPDIKFELSVTDRGAERMFAGWPEVCPGRIAEVSRPSRHAQVDRRPQATCLPSLFARRPSPPVHICQWYTDCRRRPL